MASTINTNNIDITYPIAGQDNDTQGFRDNFRNIRNNLIVAKNEITEIQSTLQETITVVNNVPANSTSDGVVGEIAYDETNIYVCVDTDTWRRANISAWPESGNLIIAGNTITNGGKIDTDFFIANVANDQNLIANVNYSRYIANTSPANSQIANLWVTLPASAENGREIEITSLANINSCFINQSGQPVMWVSNTNFRTGNVTGVSAKFTYVSSVGKWMKF
jgi:hypothetical protein